MFMIYFLANDISWHRREQHATLQNQRRTTCQTEAYILGKLQLVLFQQLIKLP